jgi:glycerol-3-phosphate dehydrogenase (NAD(P)+)
MTFSDDIGVCKDAQMLIFAVPSIYVRATAQKVKEILVGRPVVVDAAKGLEKDTLKSMTEILEEELGYPAVALSGPTHAEEVARDMPTSIVSAGTDAAAAEAVQRAFEGSCLRVYTNRDVKGVELCGALKNIVALATGVSQGLGFGDNTKAAIITRGMSEITRLGLKMGCQESTFFGLAGIGDLIVTATSQHSRNNRAGQLIGKGYTAEQACKEVGMVVEGLNALPAAVLMAKRYQVELPIIEALNSVVNHGVAPLDMVHHLMARTTGEE